MNRSQKKELVSALHRLFEESAIVVVVHYKGMTVAETNVLRTQVREAGADFKVVKNRLARLALAGTRYKDLAPLFAGPAALACSRDPVAAARVVAKYAKNNDKLVIMGGGGLGTTLLAPDGVKALAELPSLEELRGRLVGMIQTPATRVARVLQAPAGQLARVLMAYADKDQGEAA